MEAGFFRSKEFVIGAAIGLVLITGAVVATSSFDDVTVRIHDGCTVNVAGDRTLRTEVDDTGPRRSGSGAERVVTYTADASGLRAGELAICSEVGDIEIVPSPDGTVQATFTIIHRGDNAMEAVDQARVETIFINDGGRLNVAAFQPEATKVSGLFDSRSTSMHLELVVPTNGRYDLHAFTDVGDIVLSLVDFDRLDLHTDVGDIEAAGITVGDDAKAHTDVGDITLVVNEVASGTWRLYTDVGGVELRLPAASDVGYEIDVETDVGHAEVDIGPTEANDHRTDGPSHEVYARTDGYNEKAEQVEISVATDVGGVTITTTGVSS